MPNAAINPKQLILLIFLERPSVKNKSGNGQAAKDFRFIDAKSGGCRQKNARGERAFRKALVLSDGQ